MGAGDMGALVSNAALLRLEVYGAMAHCHGNDLAPGAGVAVASHTFAHGEPITLDVPAGAHALVLTTYADSSGAHILGHGCLEVSVVAGSQSCFDLPVAADGNPGDGGSALPDGGGSDGGSAACGNQNQPCCAGATPCNANLGCVNGSCVCGGMNQPCCFGSACQVIYCCTQGTCQF